MRPQVLAKAVESPRAPSQAMGMTSGMPVGMAGGRIPDGGHGATATLKPNSIFEAGNHPQMREIRLGTKVQEAPIRPRVMAKPYMGAEANSAPPSPPEPPTNIQQVLKRETPPEGLTVKEAADLAAVLDEAIANSVLALQEGVTCISIDSSAIDEARSLQEGLAGFAAGGAFSERLELRNPEIDLIERMLECGILYQSVKKASTGKTMAFIAGGLLIGAVALLVTSS